MEISQKKYDVCSNVCSQVYSYPFPTLLSETKFHHALIWSYLYQVSGPTDSETKYCLLI